MSPVIATLILIVVAIVGAISVGLIVSRVSTDTAGQANVQNAVGNAQQNLLVGGSSTIAPVVLSAIPAIESQEHIQVTYVTSSSGQGLEGVIINSLDVAAASSYPAVTSGQDYASSSYPGVNLVSTLVGGSGEVVIANGGAGGYLVDASGNTCYAITKSALATIYQPVGTAGDTGYFTINAAACADGFLNAAGITTGVPATTPKAIAIVSRSDSSGTEDTFAAYIGVSDKTFYAGTQEAGNQGVLSFVQTAPGTNNPGGSIGFTDLGFADGAAVGVAGGAADGVSITQVFSSTTSTGTYATTTWGPLTAEPAEVAGVEVAPATDYPLAVAAGASATSVSNVVLSGLQQTSASIFPDNGATIGSTLVRTFYFVTNGAPTTTEENFISFFTQSSASSEAYWTSNGFFNLYQINAGA